MSEPEGEVIEVEPENPGKDPIGKIREISGRILSRIRGRNSGTPEEPKEGEVIEVEPDSPGKKAPRKRRVKLQTLTYDEEAEEYTLSEKETFFEDLPPEAVHVTGKKNRYFLDLVEDPEASDPTGIRATDLYLWMVNNSINDALAVKTKGLGDVDIRRYIVLGIGLIIGVCVIYAMM